MRLASGQLYNQAEPDPVGMHCMVGDATSACTSLLKANQQLPYHHLLCPDKTLEAKALPCCRSLLCQAGARLGVAAAALELQQPSSGSSPFIVLGARAARNPSRPGLKLTDQE